MTHYLSTLKFACACLPLWCVTACGQSNYTLYRNSVLNAHMRLHVASFDTSDGDAYNSENCDLASKLYMGQPGVTVAFWCEKGAFKK